MKLNDNWTLYYSKDNVIKSPKNAKDFDHKFEKIENIKLPCVFETALHEAGILGDPYFGANAFEYQKYEECHQWYLKTFDSPYCDANLRLNGVDTISEVYVNGKLVGRTDNMFVPFDFHLSGLKEKGNELLIHVIPNASFKNFDERLDKLKANTYNKDLHLRSCQSQFGWDIMPRFCAGGLWKDVELSQYKPFLDRLLISTKSIGNDVATLVFRFEESDDAKSLSIKGAHNGSEFNFEGEFKNEVEIEVKEPHLWNIVGYGEQNLYDVSVSVAFADGRNENRQLRFGIRTIELHRTSIVEPNGRFEFVVNGKKVFILGSNYVPIEAIKHVDNVRSKAALDNLLDMGCNAIRIWGGGVYETEEFYSLCDEKGIFIWHDFMMACADYPLDNVMMDNLRKEVEDVVMRYGYHSSIAMWSGDNECDQFCVNDQTIHKNPNDNKLTREVIPGVTGKLDPNRYYLPSSPYVDEIAFHNLNLMSEDHLWGPRDYFRGDYYTNNKCYFASETGYHGCPSPKSLDSYISNKWPLFKDGTNIPTSEYMCHSTSSVDDITAPYAYRIGLMVSQVKTLFGKDMDNMNDFAKASQISQAEAMKYFIERFRWRRNTHGGIIWWNLIDGWPQVSDAVINYDFSKKLAYHFIKRVQQKNILMCEEKDDSLLFHVSCEEDEKSSFEWEAIDAESGKCIASGECTLEPRSASVVGVLPNDGVSHKFIILKLTKDDGTEHINHFVTDIKGVDFQKYNSILNKYALLEWEGF